MLRGTVEGARYLYRYKVRYPTRLTSICPGTVFTRLKGDLKGVWSIAISGNWRIVFRLVDADVFDVDLMDYH
jgi:plasmid maintenance system killer protein